MISIRTRILAPTIALVLAGSLALVLLALRDSHRQTEAVYDAQLVQAARVLQGMLQQPDGRPVDWQFVRQALDGALDRSADGVFSHPYEINLAFQVWDRDGNLLVRSEQAPHLTKLPAPGIHEFFFNDQEWCGVLLDDSAGGLRIWVGEREDLRQDLIHQILQHTLMPTLVCLPLLAAFIWLLLGWGLRPLQRLAQQLRERPEHSLEPLPTGPMPPELEPMRLALDDVLSQLRALLERERRFIADAAHELRTPLAILEIHVRNAAQAESVQERDEALAFLKHGVHRATRIASQLLTMARLEAPSQNLQPLDLTAVVREELADLAPLALNRRIDLALEAEETALIQGDRGLIVILLQNLVSNALTFSSPGSEVSVRVCREREGVHLQVVDQGPGVEEARLPRLGERFHSAGNPHGAGLGLAIVGMIARHLGGSIGFSNASPQGFRAVIRFPAPAL